ncbi:LysR family transcriptional regulator [Rhodobacteraceae bacterium SC52]|nr:LysR family transcriptional regulator [Rhodobacteraceae bacterium SC52]
MDWRAMKFDWNRARAFLVTAEEGSLSAAARALGMAQPTLGRQVAALEDDLGVLLFDRVGKGLVLTPSGLDLLDHVRAMGAAASRVSLAATGRANSVEGDIIITASEIYSTHLLPPVIADLRRTYPGLNIEIIASNLTLNIQRREADIAIRSYRPQQPDLIARKLRDDQGRFYATPAYLDRIGPVVEPSDLSRADFIGFEDTDVMRNAFAEQGIMLERRNFPIITANHIVHWELCKSGVGIGIVPEHVGDREQAVRRALPSMAPMVFPIWLTTHRELHSSRRVRTVFDALADALSRPPA